MVAFNQIPDDNLVPGTYAEFDKSQALQGDPTKPHRGLIIGIVPADSDIEKNTPVPVRSEAEVLEKAGKSSLAGAAYGWFRRNRRVEVHAIAIEEPDAGVAAKATIEITGTATEDGVLPIYLNGVRIQVGVSEGDEPEDVYSTIEDAINDAIDRNPYLLPFSVTANVDDVEIECAFKGIIGNDNTLRVAIGPRDKVPAGLEVNDTDFTGGDGSIDDADAVAAMGDTRYDTIAAGIDANSVSALIDHLASQWGAKVQKDGLAVLGMTGSHGTVTTILDAINTPYVAVVPTNGSPTPPWVWAGQIAGADALKPDTPRPRRGMALPDCAPPPESERWDHDERNLVLQSGGGTFT
ncbi:MAG: phage tail sheath subtilisin-like domain-containing protein, partial [Myxococcota bacterium]